MRFPDPNIGYVCGYKSRVTDEGILVTFCGGIVKILFRFDRIKEMRKEVYTGGRISWDIIRWGKCPKGKEALRITLKDTPFKDHLIVFDDLGSAIKSIKTRYDN